MSDQDKTMRWYAWKEQHENWRPYHIGTTPGGARCSVMPRCVPHPNDTWRCPSCGKVFPTYTSIVGTLPKEPKL